VVFNYLDMLDCTPGLMVAVAAVAVFLGHLFPIFLRFKGGKGVATALGVLLAFNPWVGLSVLAIWLVVALVSRYSSLAALVAAAAAPVCVWLFNLPSVWIAASCVIAVLLIWRHKSNIKNLLAGTEGRIGGKKTGS
jgi:glycerol-3-phosphate acyltransferase PlsY